MIYKVRRARNLLALTLSVACTFNLLAFVLPPSGQTKAAAARARALSNQAASLRTFTREAAGRNGTSRDDLARARAGEAYGRLPLSFIANEGQTDPRVKFISRGAGYSLFLTSSDATLVLRQKRARRSRVHDASRVSAKSSVLRMRLENANEQPQLAGEGQLKGRANFLTGSDPQKWRRDVPAYSRVKYGGVYPGIDLAYYGNQGQLEYDFVVAPGADYKNIRLAFEGASRVRLDRNGDLVLRTACGEIRQPAPVLYQDVDGERRGVSGRYVLLGKRAVGFRVDEYDATRPLVIDPVLVYATYFGGSGLDEAYGIAVDSAGSAYVTGVSDSEDFPTTDGALRRAPVFGDAFVLKLSPDGNSIVYCTFLGGSKNDIGEEVRVDSAGNAYVGGWTSSTDFPTRNAYQSTHAGGVDDAFLTKLNSTGTDILYSTFLGGDSQDVTEDLAIDPAGNAYVGGLTSSSTFPTTAGAFHTTAPHAVGGDGFVAKINTNAAGSSSLVYSTYFEVARGVAVDASGAAYLTGFNYIAKLNPSGAAQVYRYDFGTNGAKVGFLDVAVDSAGSAYAVGSISQGEITVRNGFQPTHANLPDAVLVKLNAQGTDILYSTYLGGSGAEHAMGVAVDNAGNAYVVGGTISKDFPVKEAVQPFNGDATDAFVAKVNTNGAGPSSLVYSTYFGINYNEAAMGVDVDSQGSAYVCGLVYTIFITGIIHTGINSAVVNDDFRSDTFVSPFALKIADSASSTIQFSSAAYQAAESAGAAQITVTRTGDTSAPASVAYATIDSTAAERSDYAKASGTLNFAAGETSKTFSVLITDDAYVEGNETVNLVLRNPTGGAALGIPAAAQLTITDNDAAPSSSNPIDDARFFVNQHYADFLNRLPDQGGLDYWTNRITQCGNDASCVNSARREVSAAFFIESEFQQTGAFLIRVYNAAPGRQPGYAEFVRDRSQLALGANLESSKQAFLNEFVQRPEFLRKYPAGMSGGEFIAALLKTVKDVSGVDLADQRPALLADYNANGSRARVVRLVVDDSTFAQAEYNRAFVLAEYFGYLRRDPDQGGYDFWVGVLNRLPAPNNYLSMVCAFITSAEYQKRFAPFVSHANSECSAAETLSVSSAPSLTSIDPSSGPVGTDITLRGSGFSAGHNRINFGGGAVADVPSGDGQTITFVLPAALNPACYYSATPCLAPSVPLSPGTYQVSVTNEDGTSNGLSFTVK